MQTNQLKKVQEFVREKCQEKFKVDHSTHILPDWNLNLSVILNAFPHSWIVNVNNGTVYLGENCEWQLMTENGYQILFDAQSEKVQRFIAKKLGFKQEKESA